MLSLPPRPPQSLGPSCSKPAVQETAAAPALSPAPAPPAAPWLAATACWGVVLRRVTHANSSQHLQDAPRHTFCTLCSSLHTCILLRASVSGSDDTCPAVTQGCFMHSAAVSLRPGSTTSSLRTRSLALQAAAEQPGGNRVRTELRLPLLNAGVRIVC
jgi:hypothetical protein